MILKRFHSGRLIAAMSALLFVYGFYMGGLQLVIADISAAFGMKDAGMQATGIGLLVSVPHIVALFLPILVGAISDRFGKKKMLLLFSAIFAAGCAIAGSSGSMAVYLVGATFVGTAHSVCESVATAVVSDADPKNAARNINISQGVLSAGAVLGPIIFRWLIKTASLNWRYLFAISGGGFLVMIAVMAVMKFPTLQSQPHEGEKKEKGSLQILKSAVLLCALVAMTLYIGLEKGVGNFAESLFSEDLAREDLGAYAISLYWIGMTVSRFAINPKMEKLSRSLMLHFAACAVLFVALCLSKSAYLSLGICFAVGFAFGPIWPSLVAMGTQEMPEHSGAVAGMMGSFGAAGSLLTPVLMGAISDSFGLRIGFLLMAVFSVAGLVLMIIAKKRK